MLAAEHRKTDHLRRERGRSCTARPDVAEPPARTQYEAIPAGYRRRVSRQTDNRQ